MTRRLLVHPLWVHAPAVLLIGMLLYALHQASPLPVYAPLHFNFYGRVNRWGDPREVFVTIVPLCLFWLGLGVLIDELWARSEVKRRFNWLSLLDEFTIAPLVAFTLYYLSLLRAPAPVFHLPVTQLVVLTGGAMGAAALLELLRPWRPPVTAEKHWAFDAAQDEIVARITSGQRWAYWERQNPAWMNGLLVALAFVFLGLAVGLGTHAPGVILPMVITLPLLLLPLGGLRVAVTPEGLRVRLGIFGLPLLTLPLQEIAAARLHDFSPLQDFGGYGIRINREMKAYFFQGTRGVLVRSRAGKKYLIGSDTPERLHAVLQAAGVAEG